MTMVADVPVADVPVGLVDVVGFGGLGGGERDAAYLAVEFEIRRLNALQAALLAEVARSGSYLDDGHRSPGSWHQAVINTSRPAAVRAAQTAAMLAQFPGFAAAAAAGRIGGEQLGVLRRLSGNDRCGAVLADSVELLASLAASLTCREFTVACRRWEAHADPDGCHRDHEISRRNRHVRISTSGAAGVVHAEGDAFSVDTINEILDAHTEAEFNTDVADRHRDHGADAARHPLARTARQRRFDALITIFTKAAATTDPTVTVPTVNIFCTETELADAIRTTTRPDTTGPDISRHRSDSPASDDPEPAEPAKPAEPADHDPTRTSPFRLSETASGARVDPHDLAIAALTGHIRRVVTDSAGRVIDLGRRQRLYTGATREAVLLTGSRCCHPGCDLRIPRINIDHIHPWNRDGTTTTRNGSPLCSHHNRHKHTHRYTVTRDPTGWHHYRPDGTEIAPRNPPQTQ